MNNGLELDSEEKNFLNVYFQEALECYNKNGSDNKDTIDEEDESSEENKFQSV